VVLVPPPTSARSLGTAHEWQTSRTPTSATPGAAHRFGMVDPSHWYETVAGWGRCPAFPGLSGT